MQIDRRHYLASFAILASLLTLSGCKKKTVATPPPAPAMAYPAPTATITASPTVVSPGDGVALVWHTENATDVSIDGIGKVPSSGTQTVNPTSSTNYHLVARGDGGSSDATTRVTVNSGMAATSTADSGNTVTDDASFRQNVQDVFFDYDSDDVSGSNSGVVAKDAAYLTAHPNLKVVIGGYCDERGSTEYNLALGDKRASSVKTALMAAGVSPSRVRTVSYGKEKQFCSEHEESCWQQNRRGQFSIDR